MTNPPPEAMSRRIVLATYGSLGDLHPYLAIGLVLRARGHRVVIATSDCYRAKVEALGLGFHACRPDAEIVRTDPEVMRRVMNAKTGSHAVIREIMMPWLRQSFDDLAEACRGADVLVGHVLTYAARLVAEKAGILWISSVLQPIALFSANDPPVVPTASFLEHLRFLGPTFHRTLFRVARRSMRSWSEPWHRLRADLGLPPTSDDPIFEGQHSPDLVLALFSEALAAKQVDWPAQTVVTGFPFYDEDGKVEVPEGLQSFLDAGTPPIVFTLGSSAVADPGDFFELAVRSAAELGCRAVLLVGREPAWSAHGLPPGVAAFDYAPFSMILPRALATVHQGGVGTTGQAMRAGRPMLVIPYAHDQPDNAARTRRLGIARTLPRHRLSLGRLTRELKRLLKDPGYVARARAIATRVAREDGAGAAADAIERACVERLTS